MSQSRTVAVVFAVCASVLVATAPVAATHQLSTVSIHTTDADFEAGALTNMTVTGSGASANVSLDDFQTIDSHEDGDIDEYGGDTDSFTVISSTTSDGSFALNGSGGGATKVIADTDRTVSQGETFAADLRNDGGVFFAADNESGGSENSGYWVELAPESGTENVKIFRLDTGSPTKLLGFDAGLSADTWYNVTVDWGTDDSINVTVSTLSGTFKGENSTTDGNYTTGGIGWRVFNVGQMDNFRRLKPAPNGTYISANHSAENTEQGFVDMTEVTNATVTVTWETSDGGAWHTINQTSGITTAANHTFTWPVESNSTVRVNVTVENESTNGEPAFTMADEGVQFTAAEPTVDNASATPTGELSTATPTLEIDVNDSDFPLAQGDTATVEFFVDGVSEGTDTLTANGTASLTTSTLDGGDHNWSVTVTDEYGHSVNSETFNITVPSELQFRNESDGDELVSSGTKEVTFISGDTIVEKTTTGSNVSLEGLPVDQEMVVVVEVDGWSDRTIILDDIFTQSNIFLLNDSLTSTTVTFTVEDRTGQFSGGNSDLIIERIINVSGSPEWRRVQAEKISTAGVVVEMERDERYRIKARSDDGDIADLGHITAQAQYDGKTLNLVITEAGTDLQQFNDFAWNASYEIRDDQADRIRFDYETQLPGSDGADDFRLIIYEHNNASNEIHNQSYGDDVSSLTVFKEVPNDNKTWVVEWSATLEGEDISGQILVGGERFEGPPLDPVWAERGTIGVMLITAGLFSAFNAGAGAFVLGSMAGIAWYFDLLPAEVGAGSILLALLIAALYVGSGGDR